MKGENLTNIKKEFENVETILALIENFINAKGWKIPAILNEQILSSCLLPYV